MAALHRTGSGAHRSIIALAALYSALATVGQVPAEAESQRSTLFDEQWIRLHSYQDRISETKPQDRDGPLRYLNITDDEVREVVTAADEVFKGERVYISSVYTGCPCEDGEGCKDQVWVMSYNKSALFKGLLLSKIDDRWQIGPVQRWWLDRAHLEARQKDFKNHYDFIAAEDRLSLQFPACAKEIERIGERYRWLRRDSGKPDKSRAATPNALSPSRYPPPSSQTPHSSAH